MHNDMLRDLVKTEEGMRAFQAERLILDVTERICELMTAKEISRKDLAQKLGVHKSRVTKLLDGSNVTLRTLSDIFHVLGRAVHLDDVDPAFTLIEPEQAAPVRITNWRPRIASVHWEKAEGTLPEPTAA